MLAEDRALVASTSVGFEELAKNKIFFSFHLLQHKYLSLQFALLLLFLGSPFLENICEPRAICYVLLANGVLLVCR